MNSKPHRQNSDFQIINFLANDCSTADGAYVLLYSQKIDMENKLAVAEAQRIRRESTIMAAEEIIADPTSKPSQRLASKADIIEAKAEVPTWEMNLRGAEMELATIVRCMDELRPQCIHYNDDILLMSEAMQEGEWLGELKTRAENYMLSQGYIPHDHLQAMRNHPQFQTHIVPHIGELEGRIVGNQFGKINTVSSRLALASAARLMLM